MWRPLISLPGVAFGISFALAMVFYFDLCPVHTSQCFRSIVGQRPLLVVGVGALFAYGSRFLFGHLGDDGYVSGPRARWAWARGLRVLGLTCFGLAVGWMAGGLFMTLGRGFLNLAAFALGWK